MSNSTSPAEPPRPTWKGGLLRGARTVALIYLGILLMLMLLENWLVYHPMRASAEWWTPRTPDVQDVYLTTSDGTKVHGWWCPRKDADGALLYLHGNAGNLSHRYDIVTTLRDQLGVSVLIVDYPGYGKSEGSPSESGCYATAEAAYDWLTKEQKIAPAKVILFGKSMGGGVAVELASRRDHRALVLVKTFTSMPDVGAGLYPWLPVRWLMRNRFDSLARIGQCKRPVFFAHGTTDRVIPFALGKELYEAANQPKQFLVLPDVDHNDPLPEVFFAELKRFLSEKGH
ncbi:MAG: alpha/beta hydrolase [Gemmataceae bacterium]|nr:alpha/beta hydrolase [Gemmataceae bacterium]